ncbi:ATP-binding protein [Flavobacterium turcicum]|uniref:histidine kinase n=1 Tax=Flavobacterium turcicum TaxID=2764718 RepID=A0ABR7JEA9_9FLAO|nr:hybrid sensor histidine kinase/response regulator [Flavobacterium turcicum]MBC5862792.1 response regulator [Flavobacterium turcicum]NHL01524.1 response regulator [Flavobacterium turcicum]
MKTIKIVLLEDNPADADLLVRQLTKSGIDFLIEITETRSKYIEILFKFKPDIVLSDYAMPSFDAISAFQILKQTDNAIPFIIVSGIIGEEKAVMLLKDGITDFASKNNLSALPQKITRAIKEFSEIKEKEEILERLKEQTATLLVANKELIFQNDEKEKRAVELLNANKELVAFNFISSHDLQEPLRKIQTFISKMMTEEKENLTEKGRKNLNKINSSATRMRRLIDDLLSYSRISTVDREYEFADLHPILEEVKYELNEIITEKNATIIANNLIPVKIVVFQFRQLIQNLVSNALKYTSTDRIPIITIETSIIKRSDTAIREIKSLPQNCNYWNMTIKDNGIGFDEQFNKRIFVIFQRLVSNDNNSGTGIGLAIVKKIVENHNGIVIAQGEIDKGATFEIYIPIVEN